MTILSFGILSIRSKSEDREVVIKEAKQVMRDEFFDAKIQAIDGIRTEYLLLNDCIPEENVESAIPVSENLSTISFSRDTSESTSVGSSRKYREGWEDIFKE